MASHTVELHRTVRDTTQSWMHTEVSIIKSHHDHSEVFEYDVSDQTYFDCRLLQAVNPAVNPAQGHSTMQSD